MVEYPLDEVFESICGSGSLRNVVEKSIYDLIEKLSIHAFRCEMNEPTPIEYMFYAFYGLLHQSSAINTFEWELRFQEVFKIGHKEYRVDFFLSDSDKANGLIIELDGHEFHEKTKEQAKRDKQRDRALQQLPYKILHYTGSEIWNDFEEVFGEIEGFVIDMESQKYQEKINGKSSA